MSCSRVLIQSTRTHRVCVHNTRVGDADAYATSDLVISHPTLPGYWRIFGRADDQLMHNTGEKVRIHSLLSRPFGFSHNGGLT